MKFFVPRLASSQYEEAYKNMRDAVIDQMRTAISERRIRSISYVLDKKRHVVTVGDTLPRDERFEVMAVFESKPFVVYTDSIAGGRGVTLLVNQDSITDIEVFS